MLTKHDLSVAIAKAQAGQSAMLIDAASELWAEAQVLNEIANPMAVDGWSYEAHRANELEQKLAEVERERDEALAGQAALRAVLRRCLDVFAHRTPGSHTYLVAEIRGDAEVLLSAPDTAREWLAWARDVAGMLAVLSPTPMVLEMQNRARALGLLPKEENDAVPHN